MIEDMARRFAYDTGLSDEDAYAILSGLNALKEPGYYE